MQKKFQKNIQKIIIIFVDFIFSLEIIAYNFIGANISHINR